MSIVTKAELARELGVSAPYFVELARKGMPTLPDGKLNREATLRWLIGNSDPRRRSKVVPRAERLLEAPGGSPIGRYGGNADRRYRRHGCRYGTWPAYAYPNCAHV